jgi:hypothetical protein
VGKNGQSGNAEKEVFKVRNGRKFSAAPNALIGGRGGFLIKMLGLGGFKRIIGEGRSFVTNACKRRII